MQLNVSNKIALFIGSLSGGGAERVMVNLARGLKGNGVDVHLVLGKATGPYLAEVPKSIKVINLGANRALTSLPGLVKYLRKEKPVAILSAIEQNNVIAIWAAKIARVNTTVVVSVHTTISKAKTMLKRGKLMPVLVRKFYPMADDIVAVSEAVKVDFLLATGLKADKVHVILNPVVTPDLFTKAKMPLRHPWFAPGEPPVILGVGRLKTPKDFPNLIRAFYRVRQQQHVRLVIIGEGDEQPKLESLVNKLGIRDDVDFHGFVDNPYSYMANASVFVLSSAWEGLPTVLIESLAIGVPVVSTDCPSGPREILKNGLYGTLVPVANEEALAQGILESLRAPKNRIIPTEAWEQFKLDSATKKYLELLLNNN